MSMSFYHLLKPQAVSEADLGSVSWIQYFSTEPCSFQGILALMSLMLNDLFPILMLIPLSLSSSFTSDYVLQILSLI